jgi:nicotinate-nucleotide pyrophosphorylase (carboxylating)
MGNLEIRLLQEITRNIETALKEDEVFRDVTTQACLPQSKLGIATLILKDEATLAGLPFLSLIAYAVDPAIEVTTIKEEGQQVLSHTPVASLKGPLPSLLSMERTLLNFFQHATSIATQTAKYVRAAKGLCDILDTRKTLPCHRFLQKYAVAIGGGKNHRFHLADRILIKDNHLSFLNIQEAISQSRKMHPSKHIQIEVETLKMFQEALEARPDAILLDNMSLSEVRDAVAQNSGGIYLEASGGIDLQNIRSYAETGVNGISIGKLTHSIDAVDMSIEIRRI